MGKMHKKFIVHSYFTDIFSFFVFETQLFTEILGLKNYHHAYICSILQFLHITLFMA